MKGLLAGFEFGRRIREAGRSVKEATLLEIGTGRRLNVPISFWLLGAERTVTVDLHSYLKAELVREDLNYLQSNAERIEFIVSSNEGSVNRLRALLKTEKPKASECLKHILEMCRVSYMPRYDGGCLPLKDDSIDYHISNQVFEHIPSNDLLRILREGSRLLKADGLLIHRIDHSDHFSHSDRRLSAINFLRFSDDEWSRLAGNRFMYMNRLRTDDYEELFAQAMLSIRFIRRTVDPAAVQLLETGDFSLAERFKGKSLESLSTIESWVVASRRRDAPAGELLGALGRSPTNA